MSRSDRRRLAPVNQAIMQLMRMGYEWVFATAVPGTDGQQYEVRALRDTDDVTYSHTRIVKTAD